MIPDNPNDRSLLSSVFINADELAYERAKRILERMDLPEAQEGEYFTGPKANADRIYLPQGLILSFVYRRVNPLKKLFGRGEIAAPVFEARKVVDERILQPLLQLDLSPQCCLEVVPGVSQIGSDPAKARELAKTLKAEGIKFDAKAEFIGLVQDQVFVANRRSIELVRRTDAFDDASAGWQDNFYGGLRDQFAHAHQSGTQAEYKKLFDMCAGIVKLDANDPDRILNTHWKGDGPNSERRGMIAKAARLYERKLALEAA